MRRLVQFFVERHLLVNVVTLAVLAIGVLTMARTNVEGFPPVDGSPLSSTIHRGLRDG